MRHESIRVVQPSPRRALVLALLGGFGALVPGARLLHASVRRGPPHPHPPPRPGITAAKVMTSEQLAGAPHAIEVFDLVREIPEIVDGIRCQCGCADSPGFYSLLSCYEADGMARFCDVCQGEAKLVHRLHHAGESLDDIRSAIDARFG